jgi:hypothetical protein
MKTPKQKAIEILSPPFNYHMGYIWDGAKDQNMVSDEGDCEIGTIARLRGWGRLGKIEDGSEIQDAIGEIIAEALNQYFRSLGVSCSKDPENCENNEGFGCDCGHASTPNHCTEDGCQKCWCAPKSEIVDGNLVVTHNGSNN